MEISVLKSNVKLKKYKMMKKIAKLALSLLFIYGSTFSQKVSTVKGTIGKEKAEDMIVICVFGTKACMPVAVNDTMKVKLNNEMVKVKNLAVGTYIEVEIDDTIRTKSPIKKITADINKTVVCFNELGDEDKKKLDTLLSKTKGVTNFKFYDVSMQVYIEYNHELISYNTLEKAIVDAGFNVE